MYRAQPFEVEEVTRLDQQLIIDAARDELGIGRSSSKPFGFTRLGELLDNVTPVDWLVKNFLSCGTLSMFFGEPESGKSLVAVDVGLHIAAGKEWRGNRVKQGAVFYICGEGESGIARRLKAWCLLNAITDPASLPFYVSQTPAQFSDYESAIAVWLCVKRLIAATGDDPVMVIVDTLARNFGPGDENSSKDMSAFVENLDAALVKNLGAHVQVVHHTGHGDKTRGRASSALPAALDNHYKVERVDGGPIQMECSKSKDFDRPEPAQFKLEVVNLGIVDEDGEIVTGATVSNEEYVPKKAVSRLSKNQKIAYQVLGKIEDNIVAEKKRRGEVDIELVIDLEFWRESIVEELESKDMKHPSAVRIAKRAMQDLEDKGHIYKISATQVRTSTDD